MTENSITKVLNKKQIWTNKDVEYLETSWGTTPLAYISKKLGRSKNAIKIKAQRLGLGAFLASGEYITFNQLLKTLGYAGACYKLTSWVKNRNFPLKYRTVDKCKFKVVYIEDFWEWADTNRDFLDFSKFEEYSLGKEPLWVKEKRKIDFNRTKRLNATPWSDQEDSRLNFLLNQDKLSYKDLALKLNRTEGAVIKRMCDLKIAKRPIKACNKNNWKQAEIDFLNGLIGKGYKYADISASFNIRSEKSIRGMVFRLYKTENLDKVRECIKNIERKKPNYELETIFKAGIPA